METSTETPQLPFRFLDLPPELRNNIYGYLHAHPENLSLDLSTVATCFPNPSLLLTNKQLYKESLDYFNDAVHLFCTTTAFTNTLTLPSVLRSAAAEGLRIVLREIVQGGGSGGFTGQSVRNRPLWFRIVVECQRLPDRALLERLVGWWREWC